MDVNFPLILVVLVFVSGLISLLDKLWLAPRRNRQQEAMGQAADAPALIEYARSLFPIFLIVLLLRSFLFEPFRIPSGSLEPTLLTGDFVVVNKYHYGLRLPVVHNKIWAGEPPKVGDILVFRWPVDESKDYIKRVIGVPGDHIIYKNKVLTVNGVEASQKLLENTINVDGYGRIHPVELRQENLAGVEHHIYIRADRAAEDFEVTVPDGQYFVMGDNRDDSLDSRQWGMVADNHIIGKGARVWLSWDSYKKSIRWDRFGEKIQ